jgi:hypothetical protein
MISGCSGSPFFNPQENSVMFGDIIDAISKKAGAFFEPIGRFLESTGLPEQFKEVDFAGLFANPWFLVPFIALVGYLLYKKAFRDMVILGAVMGVWYASGTPYMQTLVVNGEVQMNKILPVIFGGAGDPWPGHLSSFRPF